MRKIYIAHKNWKIGIILFSVITLYVFYALKEFKALYFLIPACAFSVIYFLNYKYVLTEKYFAIPLIPHFFYWNVKIEDIYEICKAKDFSFEFKKYHPGNKVLNKPIFGGAIITKSSLNKKGIGIGIFPQNLSDLIRDFREIKAGKAI